MWCPSDCMRGGQESACILRCMITYAHTTDVCAYCNSYKINLLTQAADTLAFQALQRADNKEICHHEASGFHHIYCHMFYDKYYINDQCLRASAFGASMLRSYAEEQRLIQENALVCSQLDALRRQCADEADWRRNSRELQAQLAQKSKELASQQQKVHCLESVCVCACACARIPRTPHSTAMLTTLGVQKFVYA
jgi:hypothetical protein